MSLGAIPHDEKLSIQPERHMAKLLSQSLGVAVSPEQVVDTFRLHWSKLSLLAHLIHDQQVKS